MTQRDTVPDDVPFADAVEQSQPAAEPADEGDGAPPLESDESDWREQRLTVELDAEDDFPRGV